jgi:hypothetical protein
VWITRPGRRLEPQADISPVESGDTSAAAGARRGEKPPTHSRPATSSAHEALRYRCSPLQRDRHSAPKVGLAAPRPRQIAGLRPFGPARFGTGASPLRRGPAGSRFPLSAGAGDLFGGLSTGLTSHPRNRVSPLSTEIVVYAGLAFQRSTRFPQLWKKLWKNVWFGLQNNDLLPRNRGYLVVRAEGKQWSFRASEGSPPVENSPRGG